MVFRVPIPETKKKSPNTNSLGFLAIFFQKVVPERNGIVLIQSYLETSHELLKQFL